MILNLIEPITKIYMDIMKSVEISYQVLHSGTERTVVYILL